MARVTGDEPAQRAVLTLLSKSYLTTFGGFDHLGGNNVTVCYPLASAVWHIFWGLILPQASQQRTLDISQLPPV